MYCNHFYNIIIQIYELLSRWKIFMCLYNDNRHLYKSRNMCDLLFWNSYSSRVNLCLRKTLTNYILSSQAFTFCFSFKRQIESHWDMTKINKMNLLKWNHLWIGFCEKIAWCFQESKSDWQNLWNTQNVRNNHLRAIQIKFQIFRVNLWE